MTGILNVLKPCDMSSQQAVQAIKRITHIKKVGHSGTLDPAAAGVLPVFLGSATRLTEYAMEGDKEYIAEVHFGIETDTQDAQGKIIRSDEKIVSRQELEALIAAIPAELWQIPPAYSAIKIGGQKMVDLARRGITREIPRRRVFIYEKELLCEIDQNKFLFRIRCSKGTYIRTLCHDLGVFAGTCAHCSFLLRTKSGPFSLQSAVTLEQIDWAMKSSTIDSLLSPMGMAVAHLPKVLLSTEDTKKLFYGQSIPCAQYDSTPDEGDCSLWFQEELVGIGQRELDAIQPKKVFHGE